MSAQPGSRRSLVVLAGLIPTTLAFLTLWANYAAMPPDIVVLRNLAGDATRWAAKSPLTVFRVAVIGVISVLAAAVMLLRADVVADGKRHTAYSEMFSILVVAAGTKSAFEALELVAHAGTGFEIYARLFWLGTVASALLGAGLALLRGWPVLTPLHRSDWRMTRRERVVLVILGVVYLSAAVWPLLGSRGEAP